MAFQTVFGLTGLLSVAALAYGLLVAPWMTLLTRSTLAGAVFTVALPALVWQLVSLVVAAWFGADGRDLPEAAAARMGGFVWLTLGLWVAGPLLSYRAFSRWEATAAAGQPLRWPRWLTWSAGRAEPRKRSRGRPWVRLVAKELRLQSPAFVVGGLYVLICGTDIALQWAWPRPGELSLTSEVTSFVTLFHVLLVSLLAGALACAEDRATEVLPWHLTLPIALRTQWRVKVGVALGTAHALGVALPGTVLGLGRSPILNDLRAPLAGGGAGGRPLCAGVVPVVPGEHDARLALGVPLALLGAAGVRGRFSARQATAALWNAFMPFDTDGRTWLSVGIAWLLFSSVGGGLAGGGARRGRAELPVDRAAGCERDCPVDPLRPARATGCRRLFRRQPGCPRRWSGAASATRAGASRAGVSVF
ncbi:MAG: hypothetical protein HS113_12910 [Verrucomicrobiales bacterium]|nr:hypothetical protein [Verrucomicrobiales bacterium]